MRWDSGKKFIYRIGAEDAHDLRVSPAHYFFVLITFCLFGCPPSFSQLVIELANLFYYLSSVLSVTFLPFVFFFQGFGQFNRRSETPWCRMPRVWPERHCRFKVAVLRLSDAIRFVHLLLHERKTRCTTCLF